MTIYYKVALLLMQTPSQSDVQFVAMMQQVCNEAKGEMV